MMSLPTSFGRYLLLEKIATGGMAEIFKAKLVGIEGFEKTLVIKRILPFWSERKDFVTMLVDEAKVLVHLNHPNIVQVYELGRVGDTYFIAMEYVDGSDLRKLVQKVQAKDQALPQEIAISIVLEALHGLYYAHERRLPEQGFLGIVHRDISPQNILFSMEGEVKVTDFGIAKAVTQTHETQTGVLKGKYAYMSPEQALGQPLDHRSDLFSMAIVLYELLFNKRLFASKSDVETLDKVRRVDVPWPEITEAGLLPGVSEVLKKALALEPEERFASAEAFAEALEDCLPKGRRVTKRRLAEQFQEIFAQELTQKHREVSQPDPTPTGERKTQVATTDSDGTVSMVGDATEVEGANDPTELREGPFSDSIVSSEAHPALQAQEPKKRKVRYLPIFLSLLWLALAAGLAYIVTGRFASDPEPKAKVVQKPIVIPSAKEWLAKLPIPPEAFKPKETPPPAPPKPEVKPKGNLTVSVNPSSAQLIATYGDEKKKGKGKLELKDLPEGTKVKVQAVLQGYEPKSDTFTISAETPNLAKSFQLKKKPPQYGTLKVNAHPWAKISVSGVASGRSNFSQRVQAKNYTVRVSNSAFGKTWSARAVVRNGRTTRCYADFEKNQRLVCR